MDLENQSLVSSDSEPKRYRANDSASKELTLGPGDKVDRWTILDKYIFTETKQRKWLCRCECGTQRYVLERSLRYGGSSSCGCLRRERVGKANALDLNGMQFGELTVIRKLEGSSGGATRWLCRCSCGEDYIALGSLLMTGRRTRCSGRKHQKNYAYTDITGQRFDRLVALYPARRYDKSGSVVWHCRCDCGKEVDLSYNTLVHTNQRSCGCQKKEHSEKLQTYLTHVAGTSVDMLKSKKVPKDNTSGYKGVYLIRGKYVAKIVFQKKQYFLGSYSSIEEAAKARAAAENVLFDAVAEHYRKWKEAAEADLEWAEKNPIHVTVNQDDGKLNVALLPQLT